MMRLLFAFAWLVLLSLSARAEGPATSLALDMPPGFKAELYARVPGARSLTVAPELGAVFVGTRGDKIFAVVDRNGDGRADEAFQVAAGLKVANGVAWHDGYLYVAEQHRIVRFAVSSIPTPKAIEAEVLFDDLPDQRWHGWRFADVGPDGLLYVSVGSPCNVCQLQGLQGTIVRLPITGGKPEIVARGIRNSVGFDWQPGSGALFFTDNGADYMGDDLPPDELNKSTQAGQHFGFPYFGGGNARTDEFKAKDLPADTVGPVVSFGAHVAPLGVHFYRGQMFPEAFRHDAFVAQHGSWNRSTPDGYRIMRIHFDATGALASVEPFIVGFLRDGRAWGRPVDLAELPDGSMLISDDHAGALYRITYTSP